MTKLRASDTRPGRPKWTLRQGLAFARDLELHLAPHWHCGLTGSVLLAGWSRNDLDIILYPHTTVPKNMLSSLVPTGREMLTAFGMDLEVDRLEVKRVWERLGSWDDKHVEVWRWRGKRVDCFWLR